ncbi:MAG: NAD(+) synthase [Firmicutes bacterium]|nr:NAD(+) synthase [Bacillota bacterium]
MFNAEKVKNDIVKWIRDWFEENGPGCNGVVAVSGGKDSSVVAALLVEALGKDRVIGVMLPRGVQPDIDMSYLLVKHLGIKSYEINVGETIDALEREMRNVMGEDAVSTQAVVNLPPRVRMAATYAVSQSVNGRVANTCNLSEDWVGYATRYGDNAGDFSPLSRLTVQEVKAVGRVLGLPDVLVDKVPSDGLQAKTDEDNLGFTYAVLDRYIREGVIEDAETKKRIDHLHKINQFKLKYMDCFEYVPEE